VSRLPSICLLFTATALAQSSLDGRITAPKGALIPNALVELRLDDRTIATVTSDTSGTFRIVTIAPGTYQLNILAAGFFDGRFSLLIKPRQAPSRSTSQCSRNRN
jgi:Carboxypeptidase regulatory-like domain